MPDGPTAATLALLLGFFGSDEPADDGLASVAERLETRAEPAAVEARLEELAEAVDRLAAEADLERTVGESPPPDAGAVRKAEALARAVDRNDLTLTPPKPRTGASDDGVAGVASSVRRGRSPRDPAATRLLDALAGGDGDRETVRRGLEAAVDALEERARVSDELAGLDVRDPEALDGASRRLDEGADADSLSGRVASLCSELADARREAASESAAREELEATVEREARARGISADSPEAAVRSLGDAGANRDVDRLPTDHVAPGSSYSRRLLAAIEGDPDTDPAAALADAVDRLDEAATVAGLTDSVDRGEVRTLAEDVEERASATTGAVGDALAERAAELRGSLDRAEETNTVIPYAAKSELEFYDRTLLPAVSTGQGDDSVLDADDADADADGDDAAAVAERLSSVSSRREAIRERYVDSRSDHNHSIPTYFLALADDLVEAAEAAADDGDDRRARALVRATEELLDRVEGLYERNEYSVMLRRLRG